MPFTIVRQDITLMHVDAIVNAANTELIMGGGVCGAIFKAAGAAKLQAACAKVSPIKTGEAAITPGFDLPSKYVIHAAGPVYSHFDAEQSERLLRSAYIESLKLACKNKCESIAFPLISSGIYGYPKDEALRVAIAAIRDFLSDHDIDIYLAIFDRTSFSISKELTEEVENYISEKYTDVYRVNGCKSAIAEDNENDGKAHTQCLGSIYSEKSSKGLDELIENLDEPFNATLLRLIDKKGKTDTEVYKRANIDRKLFSKIRKGKGYMPGKRTILALAVALELTLEETNDLLSRAGYILSHSRKFDVIVEFFIINRKYDIYEINEVLFEYDQPLLGAI